MLGIMPDFTEPLGTYVSELRRFKGVVYFSLAQPHLILVHNSHGGLAFANLCASGQRTILACIRQSDLPDLPLIEESLAKLCSYPVGPP